MVTHPPKSCPCSNFRAIVLAIVKFNQDFLNSSYRFMFKNCGLPYLHQSPKTEKEDEKEKRELDKKMEKKDEPINKKIIVFFFFF